MIIRTFVAVAALSLSAMPALADVVYTGLGVVVASNCPDVNRVGDREEMRYRPALAGGNSDFSSLVYSNGYNVNLRMLTTGSFTSVFKATRSRGIGWSFYVTQKPSQIRIISQAPASLTAGPQSMTMTLEIKNFWGDAGDENCVARVTFAGVRDE
jgi:hypothetical protein